MSTDDVIYYRCEHDMALLACPTCQMNYKERTANLRKVAKAKTDLMDRRPWFLRCAFCANPDGHDPHCLWFQVADALTVNPEVEQRVVARVSDGFVYAIDVFPAGDHRVLPSAHIYYGLERDTESNVDDITMGQVLNPLRGLKSGFLGDSERGPLDAPIQARSFEEFEKTFGPVAINPETLKDAVDYLKSNTPPPYRLVPGPPVPEEFARTHDLEDTNPPLPHPPGKCLACCSRIAGFEAKSRTVMWNRLCRGCLDLHYPEGNLNRGSYFPPDGEILPVVTTEIVDFKDGDFGDVVRDVINFSADLVGAFEQAAKAITPESMKESVENAKRVMGRQSQPEWPWRPSDGPPMTHVLKTESALFWDMVHDLKRFEVRKNDRNFRVRDELDLRELSNHHPCEPTGRHIRARVIYMLSGTTYGLQKDYVVMGLEVMFVSTKRGGRAVP